MIKLKSLLQEQTTVYKIGMRDPKGGTKEGPIAKIQQKLIDAGYMDKITVKDGITKSNKDGIYGPKTRDAVKKFQEKQFPDEPDEWDGIVGKDTTAALNKISSTGADDRFNYGSDTGGLSTHVAGFSSDDIERKMQTINNKTGDVNVPNKTGFLIPVAWPTYEPSIDKQSTATEVWAARIYSTIRTGELPSSMKTYGKLGHGGIALVTPSGNVTLFEFGRYDGASAGMGLTKRASLGPIAKISNNQITNIDAVATAIKKNSQGKGPKLPMDGYVVPAPDINSGISFAKSITTAKYAGLDLETGDDIFNCGTFTLDVAIAAGIEMGKKCFPDPLSALSSFNRYSTQSFKV